MTVSSKYDPASSENKWYKYWLDNNFFKSTPNDREPYTVVIPPPNVTGVLHMGHMLNNTIQDVLIRRARMQGFNACWVPGTDHASIATEAKVVAKLKSEGVDKRDLSRDEFLKHAWEWTEKHGGIILEQLKRLGASCDWDRTLFTMDEKRYDSVISVFVDLHNKGLIYKGVRMVNWDPEARTAVSDEEVNYTEENSRLYYVNYRIAGEDGFITIATTRPETILGDTAVCANPSDKRYAYMKGKRVIVPLVDREVPFIFDDYVEMDFGTGCLKITPAHDINDYEIGIRHNLPSIDIFNDNGTINSDIGVYSGVDRFAAREMAVNDLKASGALGKVEEYVNKVGRSERTNSIIEPKLSMQWFLKMEDLAKPALKAVLEGEVEIHPSKYVNVYRHWMENVRDWCISRQLWWGHRIPAWYYNNNDFVVAGNEEEALSLARKKSGNSNLSSDDLRQDEDVLDTWFSSWLWPIAAFDGINDPGNDDMKYYYPTNNLITAPEILFFWVARMIIAGYEYTGEKPFSNVYLHGLVRDKQRKKMSKSLGNSPDPLDLITKYGADGVRVGMLLCSPAGNDLLYDDSLPEQGRNFANKIWNAYRLIQGWESDGKIEQPESSRLAVGWMKEALNRTLAEIDDSFDKFRISDALMISYKLFWDDFSAWYLEAIKPEYEKPIDIKTLNSTLSILEQLLLVLHPFMPFITEELWQQVAVRKDGESIMVSSMPNASSFDIEKLSAFDEAREIISAVRNVRKERNLAMKEQLILLMNAAEGSPVNSYEPIIIKLGNLSSLRCSEEKPSGAISFLVGTREFFIPLEEKFDKEAEIEKLEKELNYLRGFLKSVIGKLSNERFVNSAPVAVVDVERKKQADAESKISLLENQIESLRSL